MPSTVSGADVRSSYYWPVRTTTVRCPARSSSFSTVAILVELGLAPAISMTVSDLRYCDTNSLH